MTCENHNVINQTHAESKTLRQKTDRWAEMKGFATLDQEQFPEFEKGTVWIVGAGPGAPGLLTLIAFHALKNADVVIYDALVDATILQWVRPGAHMEYAGKRGGKPSAKQQDISLRLVELAKRGKRVLRLKGGDPFIFGRGAEECQMLAQHKIKFRIVPGITAAIGALAYSGIPATHRDTNHSVTFLTGHDFTGETTHQIDWQALHLGSPVIVIYMAIKHLETIAEHLIKAGRDKNEPLAIVANASLTNQKIYQTTLIEIPQFLKDNKPQTPAVVIVGKTTQLHQYIHWYDQKNAANQLA